MSRQLQMNLKQYLITNPNATLAQVNSYADVLDKKKVGSGQARGYLVNTGIWTQLRTIQADMTNPLFALADAIIVTASDASSFFGMDISTTEGVSNIAGIDILVGASVMTPTQKVEFIAMSVKSTYPLVDTTQTEFDDTKALIALETNPTKITVTNPANAPHILRGRSQEIHVI